MKILLGCFVCLLVGIGIFTVVRVEVSTNYSQATRSSSWTFVSSDNHMSVSKFKDGAVTCYALDGHLGNGISCLKD